MTRRPGPGAYARSLERALSRVRERPVLLSPRDWALASDWYGRQIPVAVVLEAIEEAAQRGRKRSTAAPGPRSLAYVASAVEESWDVILKGRAERHTSSPVCGTILAGVRDSWERAVASAPRDSCLSEFLSRLLGELESGTTSSVVDGKLDEGLPDRAPPILLVQSREKASAELEPFRERMSRETYEATLRRAVVERLRRALKLPRLP